MDYFVILLYAIQTQNLCIAADLSDEQLPSDQLINTVSPSV